LRATAGKEFHLALKINCYYFIIKYCLVNTIKNGYNIKMRSVKLSRIQKRLINSGKTVATAESCSGGLLSCWLTSKAGSSAYFILGLVVYSNRSKQKILAIPAKTISRFGAVSRQTALSMAKNVRRLSGADFGISITGIAGPSGAVPGKPAGTVFVGLSSGKLDICRRFLFPGGRLRVRKQAASEAMRLLCAHL
jgi:PncC family amidohydrolase